MDLPIEFQWMERSECLDIDTETFFAHTRTEFERGERSYALRLCNRCEVRDECLQYAVDTGVTHGIFGGIDFTDRKMVRKATAILARDKRMKEREYAS